MMNTLKILGITFFFLAYSALLQAHGRYILPSHTQLSGEEVKQVTLLASISNDVFHPDKPLGNNGGGEVNSFLVNLFKTLKASTTAPDGTVSNAIEWQAFSRQSISDITIDKSGTYRISLVQQPTAWVTFKNADGTPSRSFGNKQALPPGATDVVYHTTASRTETFITHNTPNRAALKSTGSGLELMGKTHPNDLFVGETADFQLFLDGKPLNESAVVHITRDGTRHRNQRNTLESKTDTSGIFSIVFDQAGMYLLEVEHTQKGTKNSGIDFHHNTLYVALEVFPE